MLGILEQPGRAIAGFALCGMVIWLARYDVASRTVRMAGQPRFMATAMLLGYAWLGIAGALLLLPAQTTYEYDLILHAVFIGFVFSMVLGHALIIFPGLTGVTLRYSPWLYLPLATLHLAVCAWTAGDFLELGVLRSISGPLVPSALLMFIIVLTASTRRSASVQKGR